VTNHHPMHLRQLRIRYEGVVPALEMGGPGGTAWVLLQPVLLSSREWQPPTDLSESESEWLVKVEAAALSEESLEVLLYEDMLIIRGHRPWQAPQASVRLHLAEIRYGQFQVAVRLPRAIDRDRTRARYDAGLIVVHLPKGGAS
jgi:HSP20 family protein